MYTCIYIYFPVRDEICNTGILHFWKKSTIKSKCEGMTWNGDPSSKKKLIIHGRKIEFASEWGGWSLMDRWNWSAYYTWNTDQLDWFLWAPNKNMYFLYLFEKYCTLRGLVCHHSHIGAIVIFKYWKLSDDMWNPSFSSFSFIRVRCLDTIGLYYQLHLILEPAYWVVQSSTHQHQGKSAETVRVFNHNTKREVQHRIILLYLILNAVDT